MNKVTFSFICLVHFIYLGLVALRREFPSSQDHVLLKWKCLKPPPTLACLFYKSHLKGNGLFGLCNDKKQNSGTALVKYETAKMWPMKCAGAEIVLL